MLVLRTHRLLMDTPATVSCHASTLLPLPDGRVLAAWFGGSREKAPDVDIWVASGDGRAFSAPRRTAWGPLPFWNPVLHRCDDGRVLLFCKEGPDTRDWRTLVLESADGGETFSPPRELVPGDASGGRGPVRCKPLRLRSGRVLAPASVERGVWRCFVDISDDDCRTWRRSPLLEVPGLEDFEARLLAWQRSGRTERPAAFRHGRGIIQPTLWEDDEGAVHALMRSGEGRVYRSSSSDRGETWSVPAPTELPNNNSGIDLCRMDDGALLLACNPVEENFGARTPLVLLCSRDNGASWEPLCSLETAAGEYSYPAVVRRGNNVLVSYTWNRQNIAYWEFAWQA